MCGHLLPALALPDNFRLAYLQRNQQSLWKQAWTEHRTDTTQIQHNRSFAASCSSNTQSCIGRLTEMTHTSMPFDHRLFPRELLKFPKSLSSLCNSAWVLEGSTIEKQGRRWREAALFSIYFSKQKTKTPSFPSCAVFMFLAKAAPGCIHRITACQTRKTTLVACQSPYFSNIFEHIYLSENIHSLIHLVLNQSS